MSTKLDELRDKLQAVLPGIEVEFHEAGQLPRTRSGKVVRFIVEIAPGTGK